MVAGYPLRRGEVDDTGGDGDVDLGVVELARCVGEIGGDLDRGLLGLRGGRESGQSEQRGGCCGGEEACVHGAESYLWRSGLERCNSAAAIYFAAERRFDGCDEAWVVGSDLGREAGYDGTIAAYEELLEVPEDAGLGVGGAAVFAAEEGVQLLAEALAAGTDGLGLGGDERLVERMGVGAGDGDLLEHGEVDAVGAGAEGGDLGVRSGLLGAEVVGGEAEYDESGGFEARVKVFECGVLLGEAAL